MGKARHLSAIGQAPDVGVMVGRPGRQVLAIRAENRVCDRTSVVEAPELSATGHLPDARGAVVAGSGEELPIRAEVDVDASWSWETRTTSRPPVRLPDAGCSVVTPGDDVATIGVNASARTWPSCASVRPPGQSSHPTRVGPGLHRPFPHSGHPGWSVRG